MRLQCRFQCLSSARVRLARIVAGAVAMGACAAPCYPVRGRYLCSRAAGAASSCTRTIRRFRLYCCECMTLLSPSLPLPSPVIVLGRATRHSSGTVSHVPSSPLFSLSREHVPNNWLHNSDPSEFICFSYAREENETERRAPELSPLSESSQKCSGPPGARN